MSSNEFYKKLMGKYNGSGGSNSQEKSQSNGSGGSNNQKETKNNSSGHKKIYQSLIDKYDPEVNEDYVNRFIEDANSFLEGAERDYSRVGYTTGSSIYESWKKTSDDLTSRRSHILQYMDKNKDSMDEEQYESWKSVVDEFEKASGQTMNSLYEAKTRYDDDRLKDYSRGYAKYGWQTYTAEKEKQQSEEEEKSWFEKAIAMIGGSSDSTLPGANITQVMDSYSKDTSYKEPTDQWNDDLRNAFGYLYSKDPEEAGKFAEEINNQLNAQEKEEQKKKVQESATDSFWGGATHTAGALLTAPLGLADYLSDIAEYNARGTITEKAGMTPFEYSQAVTSGVSEHLNEEYGTLNEDIPVIGGKGLGDVYGLGTSIAQSALAGYTGGQYGTLIQFFGSAAASGIDEAKQRGATDEQAVTYGTLVGAAEGVAEMIGVDNLLNIGSSATMREVLVNVAKQGVAEGLEEGITSVLNNFADQLTMGDMSNFNVLVSDYMGKGWSEEEARKQAWIDMAEDVAYDMLGGFVSGSVHAGPQTAYQTYAENKEYSKVYGSSATELVQQGLESAEGSLSHELAVKYQEKLDGGGTLTGAELNRLVKANEQEFLAEDKASIKQAAENRLTELGEVENVSTLADILTKQATKQKLTRAEQITLSSSRYGERVSNELNPKNAGTGEYSNAWAGQIGTSRINAAAYNQELVALANEMSGVDTSSAEQAPPGQGSQVKVNKVATENKQPTQGNYELSKSGKTTYIPDDQEVSIKEIATIKDGHMTFKLDDGRVIDSKDVSYANNGEALVYETVAHMGVNSAAANVLVNAYHTGSGVSAEVYAHGIQEAYRYGQYSYPVQELARGPFSSMLTEQQRNTAYKLGKMFGGKQVAKAQATIEKSSQVANKNTTVAKNVGKVHFDGNRNSLTERQSASLAAMEKVAEIMGVQIHVFESKMNERGQRVGANGWYDPKDSSIHIDLHAGAKGEDTMLFTAAHELVHFIKQWSPAKFKTLANFLMKEYGQKGVSVEKLVQNQIAKAERSGRTISYDTAYEEVIADSMETMLADGNVMEKLAKLKQQDKSLWQKIKDFISELAAKIRKVYDGLTPDSVEGRYVAEMVDSIEKLQELFTEGLMDASENYQSSLTPGVEGVVTNQNGDPVAHATADGTVQLSMRTYEEEGREAFRKYLQKCVSSKKLTKAEMQEMLNGIEEIYEVCKEFKDKYAPFSAWSDAAVVRDTRGKPVFSVVTPNGDYKMNLDFSLVCKKRRTLDAVFNEMSRRGIIDDFELGQKSVVKINEIIRKYGLETACALCFVDAKRFRQASMADQFTSLYNELVESLVPENQKGSIDHFNFAGYGTIKKVEGSIDTWANSKLDFSHINHVLKTYGDGTVEYKAAKYIKNNPQGRKLLLRGDFMSSQGFDAVKSQNQDILKLYNSKKGTGGPKAAFGDVQYMNEVIQKARWWTPAKAYAVGGVRIQSFSDYVPRMVFDYTQMIYDLAASKLPAHAYTKEALFVKQFGLTGVKINMSLIPAITEGGIAPGLDANGDYVWAGESFDFETAKEIQNAEGYTENCGTICVGVSYEHIRKLLSDPNIRMVIPYHKSGLNPIVAHMNKIAEFTDYTTLKTNPGGCQNTMDKNGNKVETDFNFNEVLRKTGDPKATVRQYLDWCAKKEYTPRFAEFAWHENYYKLIEDFTLYDKDGNYVPQREVRAVFPKETDAFGSMKDLIQEGLQEDAVVEGKRDKNLSKIVDEIQETLPKTEAEIEETQVAQADRDLEATEIFHSDVLYSERVTDKETLNFLNKQETITTYKTMQIVDGKLYPPMAARTNGAYEDYSELGAWEQATEHPELIKNGNKFKLDKGKGQGSIEAAYNPYMHSSNLVLNDQFSGAYTRDNLVTVECEVPVSELTSGYHAQYAKDSVGWHAWHTGTVAGSLRKARGIERQVFLSRWIKPVRIVPDSEVASMYKDLLDGTDIAVPDNVVTPSLLKELKNAGVKIKESGRVKYSDRDFTYQELTAKSDLKGRVIRANRTVKLTSDGSIDRSWVLSEVLRQCESIQTKAPTPTYYVNVSDIGKNVEITGEGIRHGFIKYQPKNGKPVPQKSLLNARVSLDLPQILRNSIEVNRSDRGDNAEVEFSHILIGVTALEAPNGNVEYYAVRSVVEARKNQGAILTEANVIGKLHAMNAKKIGQPRVQVGTIGTVALTGSSLFDYSVANLLNDVKNEFDDTFSNDVYKHFGMTRNANSFSQYLKYSDRDTVERAKEYFGTTTNFEEAGFILPSGEMLKFTDDKHRGERQYDHRAIGIAYGVDVDLNVHRGYNKESNKHLDDFVEKGGIRFDPGSLEFNTDAMMQMSKNVPITSEQEQTIREFIEWKKQREEQYDPYDDPFSLYRGPIALRIDFGDTSDVSLSADRGALGIKHLSYEGGQINASRIINDIRHYYRTGETRKPSTIAQFLYSERDTDSVSNRSLLANAFEGVAQNDIERTKIQEYKGKIELINAEEQKLSELNEQIKELSFAKGSKDTKKIRDLQFEAKQTANRISTYDKQLLRLEASKPLQDVLTREKKMAYQRAEKKGKEALAAYKEKAAKTQQELLHRYQDSRKKGIENRHRTEMKNKIKGVVNELNQYLLKGDKDKRVMMPLKKAVAEALDAVNMDTVGAEERIAKLEADLMKAKTPEAIQEISRKIDRIREMDDKMSKRLKALKDAYREIADSDDPLIANAHDDVIEAKLESVIEKVGNTALRDMNLEQLNEVYDMYRMVLTTIRNSNKAFKAARSESIAILGNRVMEEVEQVGGKKKYNLAAVEAIKKFGWNNLKPVYAFEHIGSHTLSEIFNNVRSGEDVWAQDVTEAREYYLEKSKKYKYNSWNFDKRFTFTSSSSMNFSLNLEQIMSLYAYSKREQAADHLKRGGIVIDESTEITMKTRLGFKAKFNPTEATAYNISEETLADIVSKLTPEQKQFVDDMQDYLSTTMGEKGNEVSLELYGIKLFKEKFYFPLKSASQFMAKAKEQQQGEVKIKNSGFSKETVKKASNPIVLTPFMNVWSNHVNEMSMYHAFVLPMEDFYRVYNYRTPTSDTMATESVEMFIQNAYGKGATKYIDQLLKDLNGGARTDSTTGIINKMMGMYKKGAVFASLSVVVQQPSAIARAAALVDTKYFIGPKVDHKRHDALWNEVKQYAPVAIIKEMGYFDTNMGKSTQDFIMGKEYSGLKNQVNAVIKDSNYRDEILSKAPAWADEMAWCSIWEAVKRETKAKNPGMKVNSDEFLTKAGKRFTEVITKTQVYDSVLSRSANMRSKDTGMKMATAFMAEPTTSINMIADALLKGKRGNKKYARAAIGAVIASQILNSILVSFVYAARDDDEDETYWEKYIGSLTGAILDGLNPAGYLPFIKDIMSIVQGYDVERSDMAVISDLWKAIENLKKDDVSVYRKVEGFAGSVAQLFGLPLKNIMRDVRSIYQTVMSFQNGQQTTKAGIGYAVKGAISGQTASDRQQLYEAIMSGDQTQIDRVKARFDDQSSINSAIRKSLRENDPRIQAAAEAKYNGNLSEYTSIAKGIIGEKHFSQDDVVAAINAEINAMDKDDSSSGTQKASGLYKTEDFAVAISSGDSAMANAIKTDIIKTAQENGKTAEEAEKSFNSSASGACKELFLEGKISESNAVDALVKYCGVDQEDAEDRVGEWAFQEEYGFAWSDRGDAYINGTISEYELKAVLMDVGGKTEEEAELQIQVYDWEADGYEGATAAAVRDYNEYCSSANVPKDVYLYIRKLSNNTENDVDANGKTVYYSAMKKVMAEIGEQDITSTQKYAIARSLGWAEKNIIKYKTW